MENASTAPAYGLWTLVILNSIVFIVFAFSFARPQSPCDWRSFGAFSAFLAALFAEMYGYPLLEMMFGWRANPHFGPFHLLSFAVIGAGFWLLAVSWKVLYEAQRTHRLATSGPYARIRHPQYAGFVLIMTGFLVQWPTLVTLAMYPVLVFMYARLAKREESDMLAQFGDEYRRYRNAVPALIPKFFPQHSRKETV
jgi:protein-S-isoprenylcysteine O-methyltransferase Ste14